MTLLWTNPDTGNRFANKHLHVVGGTPTLQDLIDEGRRVYAARVRACQLNSSSRTRRRADARDLKQKYGTTEPSTQHGNTLIVLSSSGLQALEAAIAAAGFASRAYSIQTGILFTSKEGSTHAEGLVGTVHLKVRPVPRSGHHEVWHLHGATIDAPLKRGVPSSAYAQTKVQDVGAGTLGLAYAPTPGELATAGGALTPATTTVKQRLPTVVMGCPVDLSFLDDD